MAVYRQVLVFCVFMDRDEVQVHKLPKKERGQYPAILTEKAWSIKDLLFGFRGNFSRRTRREVPRKPITARYLVHFARSRS